jgi:hypothetical protein
MPLRIERGKITRKASTTICPSWGKQRKCSFANMRLREATVSSGETTTARQVSSEVETKTASALLLLFLASGAGALLLKGAALVPIAPLSPSKSLAMLLELELELGPVYRKESIRSKNVFLPSERDSATTSAFPSFARSRRFPPISTSFDSYPLSSPLLSSPFLSNPGLILSPSSLNSIN